MTTLEIKENLCMYDNRNPNFKKYDERFNKHKECYCDNCIKGKHELADELLSVMGELEEIRQVLFTDYE